jgi:hypothetical protein
MSDVTGAVWRKSSQSMSGDCVEFALLREAVGVRDSKDPTGPVMIFSRSEWQAFVDAAKRGVLDRR